MKYIVFALILSLNVLYAQSHSTKLYSLTDAFPNLQSFSSPIYITNAGDGSNRLFVVEQTGVIWEFSNTPGETTATKFLDLTNKIVSGGEMGLLSVAFHPHFSSNGYIYVNYDAQDPLRTVIARFTVSPPSSNQVDTSSEQILMEIPQPFENHKGGLNLFGPDGYLYIGMGDGGSGGDPYGNGQNRSVLLGKMLRINVDSTQDTLQYAIPPDNPFAGNSSGYRQEIYAYGLRNPWRYSFDQATGWLYCADVGQDKIEEVDILQKGKNYGWNIMEGKSCYNASHCDTIGLTLPIFQVLHPKQEAIIGGYVYHGPSVPSLTGLYIYGDEVTSVFGLFHYDGSRATGAQQLFKNNVYPSSFGLDEQKELYVVSYTDGRIYRFTAEVCDTDSTKRYRTLSADSTLSFPAVKLAIKNGLLVHPPNASTLVEALFKKLRNKTTTFLGIRTTNRSDVNKYAWIAYMKASDLGKLFTSRHDTLYYPLDSVRGATTTKMKNAIRATRAKNDDAAIEQGVAFRLNILLSDSGITPSGFGDLILDTSITLAGRQLKGISLRSIAAYYDSVMTYWQSFGINTPSAYADLRTFVETVLRPLNSQFASPILYTGQDYAIDPALVKKNIYAVTAGGLKTAAEVAIVNEALQAVSVNSIGLRPSAMTPFDFSVYPNPFNPTVTIRFTIVANPQIVTLKVYDILGREVANLMHGIQAPSEYSIAWNASNVPSGIYFAALTIDGKSHIKKLLFMK